MVHALPFYEEGNLYDQIELGGPISNRTGVNTGRGGAHPLWGGYFAYRNTVNTLLCPSDGTGRGIPSWTTGRNNYNGCFGDEISGRVPRWRHTVRRQQRRGIFSHRRGIPMGEIKDGTSNTAFLSEHSIAPAWGGSNCNNIHGCYTIVKRLDDNPSVCLVTKGPNGTVVGTYPRSHQRRGQSAYAGYPMMSGFNTVLPPNAPACANNIGEWQWGIFPPDSYHPGGVNLARADGSVSFIMETIDTGDLSAPDPVLSGTRPSLYGVWGALGTKNGGETQQP